MSKVEPALTAEEWRVRGVPRDSLNAWACEGGVTIGVPDSIVPHPKPGTAHVGFQVEGEDCAALAALSLHGQPFGFSWEDVDALEATANGVESESGGYGSELRDIAARIAALLPPRVAPHHFLSDAERGEIAEPVSAPPPRTWACLACTNGVGGLVIHAEGDTCPRGAVPPWDHAR